MGYFGFVMAGGGSVGVLLGGLLTGLLDWRSIFLVNLPIGALVLYLSLRLLPDGKGEGSRASRRRRRRDHHDLAAAGGLCRGQWRAGGLDVGGRRSG